MRQGEDKYLPRVTEKLEAELKAERIVKPRSPDPWTLQHTG